MLAYKYSSYIHETHWSMIIRSCHPQIFTKIEPIWRWEHTRLLFQANDYWVLITTLYNILYKVVISMCPSLNSTCDFVLNSCYTVMLTKPANEQLTYTHRVKTICIPVSAGYYHTIIQRVKMDKHQSSAKNVWVLGAAHIHKHAYKL